MIRPSHALLNVYSFFDTLNIDAVHEFEELMGVNVNVKYYESTGELLTELSMGHGHGYDVLAATDNAIELMHQQKFIRKLDYSKLPNTQFLDKKILGKYFDPENKYSLPYAWSVFGIGFDKRVFPEFCHEMDWSVIFTPYNHRPGGYKVGVFDMQLEMIFLTAIYVQHHVDNVEAILPDITRALIMQKPYVESYAQANHKYFLKGGVTPTLIAESSVMKDILDEDDNFDFAIPKQGTMIGIESLTISAKSQNVDLAHAFINFMISKQAALQTWEQGYNPTNVEAYEEIDEKFKNNPAFFPDETTFKRFFLINNRISPVKAEESWRLLKIAK